MRLLLDTHVVIWWLEDALMTQTARAAIANRSETLVSAVSAYKLAFKVQIGKLPGCAALVPIFSQTMFQHGFRQLEVTWRHAIEAARLPLHHRDPWDRILAAQALDEDLLFVSNDTKFDAWGVKRIW